MISGDSHNHYDSCENRTHQKAGPSRWGNGHSRAQWEKNFICQSDVHEPSSIHKFQRRQQERRTSRHWPVVTFPQTHGEDQSIHNRFDLVSVQLEATNSENVNCGFLRASSKIHVSQKCSKTRSISVHITLRAKTVFVSITAVTTSLQLAEIIKGFFLRCATTGALRCGNCGKQALRLAV